MTRQMLTEQKLAEVVLKTLKEVTRTQHNWESSLLLEMTDGCRVADRIEEGIAAIIGKDPQKCYYIGEWKSVRRLYGTYARNQGLDPNFNYDNSLN